MAAALQVKSEEQCPSGIRLDRTCISENSLSGDETTDRYSLRPEAIQEIPDFERSRAPKNLEILQSMNAAIMGSEAATHEFTVFDLPSSEQCRIRLRRLIQSLRQDYISRGIARLAAVVPHSPPDTQAALFCAGKQGRALGFLEALLDMPTGKADLERASELAGLEPESFASCSAAFVAQTAENQLPEAQALPGIRPGESSLFVNGLHMPSCIPSEQIRALIDRELAFPRAESY